jgi:hypothetical protein
MINLEEVYPREYGRHTAVDGVQLAIVMSRAIKELLDPKTVVDYGCGPGLWVKAFEDLEVDARGLEGAPGAILEAVCSSNRICLHDLREHFLLGLESKIDLAISLEVAEHIEEEFSGVFIDNILSQNPDYVIFTSSPPGMEGHGHINLKPDSFWNDWFYVKGYDVSTDLTERLKEYHQKGLSGEIYTPEEVGRGVAWFGLKEFCLEENIPEYDIWSTGKIFFPEWFYPNVRVFVKRGRD